MSISITANLCCLRNAHPQLDRIRCVQLCQCFNPLRTKSDGVAKSSSTTAKANYEVRLRCNLESRPSLVIECATELLEGGGLRARWAVGALGCWGVWMVGL